MTPTSTLAEDLDQAVRDTADACVRMLGEFNDTGALRQDLDTILRRWNVPAVPIVVVGEVSRGKSSLINGLVGQPLLGEDWKVTSSTWVRLTHSEPATVRVHLATGEGARTVSVPLGDLATYTTVAGASTVRDRHGEDAVVTAVDVGVPAPFLARGAELIDTPGVGGLRAAHRQAALSALANADAVLFVIKPGEPISASERHFLAQAVDRVDEVVIVQTWRDQFALADEMAEANRVALTDPEGWSSILGEDDEGSKAKALAARFEHVPIVSVSSTLLLEAAEASGDADRVELMQDANGQALFDILDERVIDPAQRLHRRNVLRLCSLALSRCGDTATTRQLLLSDRQACEQRLKDRRERIGRFVNNNGQYWHADFQSAYRDAWNQLGPLAAKKAKELSDEYHGALAKMSADARDTAVRELLLAPASVLGDLVNYGRRRLIDDAVGRVVALLDGADLEELVADLTVTPEIIDRLPPEPKPPGDKLFQPEDLQKALLSGISGVGAYSLLTQAGIAQGTLLIGGALFFPFLIGAGLFTGLAIYRRRKNAEIKTARAVLSEVTQLITNDVVKLAREWLEKTAEALGKEISARLSNHHDEITRAFAELRELDGLDEHVAADQLATWNERAMKIRDLQTQAEGLRARLA